MQDGEILFNKEEMATATQEEETERLQNEVAYLTNRVRLLRALANRQDLELQELRPSAVTETGEGIEATPLIVPEPGVDESPLGSPEVVSHENDGPTE